VTDAELTLTPKTVPVPPPIGLIKRLAETEYADVAVIVALTDKVTEEGSLAAWFAGYEHHGPACGGEPGLSRQCVNGLAVAHARVVKKR
jgi:hypothetical protein